MNTVCYMFFNRSMHCWCVISVVDLFLECFPFEAALMWHIQTCVAITNEHNCITSIKPLYNPSLIAQYMQYISLSIISSATFSLQYDICGD